MHALFSLRPCSMMRSLITMESAWRLALPTAQSRSSMWLRAAPKGRERHCVGEYGSEVRALVNAALESGGSQRGLLQASRHRKVSF